MSMLHRLLAASHRLDRQERMPVTVRLRVDGVTITTPDTATRHLAPADEPGGDDATPALARAGSLP